MTVKEFAETIKNEIYNTWGCDPQYYANSDDPVEAALAKRDSYLIQFTDEQVNKSEQAPPMCKCYRVEKERKPVYDKFDGDIESWKYVEVSKCLGTKEIDYCSCGGDERKCDFYDYKRQRCEKGGSNTND